MSRYSNRLPQSYEQAERMLNGKDARTLFNNTTINRGGDGRVFIAHHGSVIGSFEQDGSVMLTNAGYGSVSTRERLSGMTPPGVHFVQRQHVQRVQVPSQGIDAATGTLWISPDGTVTV